MAINESGQIKLSDLFTEFEDGTHSSEEIQLSDFFDKGNAPSSGNEIQLATDFYGTSSGPAFLGSRGIGAGGFLYPMGDGNGYGKKLINYKAITSSGNASDFGDLTDEVGYGGGVSNGSRFIQMAGEL